MTLIDHYLIGHLWDISLPASTIKPLLTTFALSNQYTSWDETIFDDGFFRFEEEQRVFNAWRGRTWPDRFK